MQNKIKTLYLIHHSHTDIGYTDLQEQIICNHINNIRQAVSIINYGIEHNTPEKDFVWNCETYYCVERYLESVSDEEKKQFFSLVQRGNIGLSATYLNFTDLADCGALQRRTAAMQEACTACGTPVKTAMNADINGISMGMRDIFIDNGVEFLYSNIHTHHGMYPLYKNQVPFCWERDDGKRLTVWSGEHYNIANVLGLNGSSNISFHPDRSSFNDDKEMEENLSLFYKRLRERLNSYENNDYSYDFAIMSVSGVFSDNAPPNLSLIYYINAFNERWGDEIKVKMITVENLWKEIRDKISDAPVYKGDFTDWWASGIGSTPYAVKHYREAQRISHICDRLEKKTGVHNQKLSDAADENMLLYSEHTWGHSSTITNPYDTMVMNLDMCKTAYASKAYEAAAMRKIEQLRLLGDKLSYYNTDGVVKVIHPGMTAGKRTAEFYIESRNIHNVKITDLKTGEELAAQVSPHPRGVRISFVAHFEPEQEKLFSYKSIEKEEKYPTEGFVYSKEPYVGQEGVCDIQNLNTDAETCRLPYSLENEWFRITYRVGEGVTSFFDKKSMRELLVRDVPSFFTPLYERTEIRHGVSEERMLLGRNVRGLHAKLFTGELTDIEILEQGAVFISVKLVYKLEGTRYTSVIIKLYREIPKIDFTLQIAKTLSDEIESIYLPLTLNLPDAENFITKGEVAMRPGIDQLPGTCKEYYITDRGLVNCGEAESYVINTPDTPLIYQGELLHHAIELSDGNPDDNKRPIYSWVMNNIWETNFKMDLSGCCEFCYSFERLENSDSENALARLADNDLGEIAFIFDE